MYVHPKFAIGGEEALELAGRVGFGTLVAHDGAALVAAHLPFLIVSRAADDVRIAFHTAANNAVAGLAEGRDCLFCVLGPDCYISPDWYASENQVSTWLYEAVHLSGPVRRLDTAAYLDHVDKLSAVFEQRLLPKKPWTSAKMDQARLAMMLKGIVALEMRVTRIEGQRKLNQHKSDVDHVAIVSALDGQGDAKGHAIADMMRALRPALDYGGETE